MWHIPLSSLINCLFLTLIQKLNMKSTFPDADYVVCLDLNASSKICDQFAVVYIIVVGCDTG